MPYFRRTKRITGRARYQTTQHRRTVAQRNTMRKQRSNKLRMFVPFRRKDHELIDYIYMVYYPERAKLTRMPAHANSPTLLGKYEYKFQWSFIKHASYNSGKRYWLLAHGRSATDNNSYASPGVAQTGGTTGGCWYTNGQTSTGATYGAAGKFWFSEDGWLNVNNAYGSSGVNNQFVRQLAQKISIVPTTPPEKRKGVICFVEDCGEYPWAPMTSANNGTIDESNTSANAAVGIASYRNNDNAIVYPLAGSSVFHSTWFPCRRSDKKFTYYSSDPGTKYSGDALGDMSAATKTGPGYWGSGANNYISNIVIAEDCDDSEVFECVYTVIYERFAQLTEQAHGVSATHNDGLSAAAGAHIAAINQHTGQGSGGYHTGTGVPLGHVGTVTSPLS